jgi:hypothetical protein
VRALSLEDWVVRSGEPVAAREGTLLLSLAEQKYVSLNATGAAIWAKLARPIQLARIRDELVAEFGAPPEEAGQAVLDFISGLAAQNIVNVSAVSTEVARTEGSD